MLLKVAVIRIIKRLANKILELAEQYRREVLYQKFNLPSSVKFNNVSFEGNILIGEKTYINDHTRIDSGLKSKVIIGAHCAIGRFVHISSKTHDLLQPTTDNSHVKINEIESDVNICDEVWIGDHCYVSAGVTIGNNAVIAAFAFVNRNVEPFEIVGGVPIKHIRFNKKHYKFNNSCETEAETESK